MRFHIVIIVALAGITILSSGQSLSLEFSDDFESGNLDSWTSDLPEDWFVSCANANGSVFVLQPFLGGRYTTLYIDNISWTDFLMEVDMRGLCGADKGIRFRDEYLLAIRSSPFHDIVLDRPGVTVASAAFPNELGEWHHVVIQTEGARIQVRVDETLYIDVIDANPVIGGRVGLQGHTGAVGACHVQWDNFSIAGEGTINTKQSNWGSVKQLFR